MLQAKDINPMFALNLLYTIAVVIEFKKIFAKFTSQFVLLAYHQLNCFFRIPHFKDKEATT
ncbi:hypothetical protein LLB_2584 [Legionella longbeachae D-4968]|nr:hypothetical protein LLB_2584 [Legionella longbeachae D-4968]